MVVSLQVGVAVKGAPAPGPPCDLTRAFTWSDTLVIMASLARSSTTEAATCCHPRLTVPGTWSSASLLAGRAPHAMACHEGDSNPATASSSLASRTAGRKRVSGSPRVLLPPLGASRTLVALRKPLPPSTIGKPAVSRMSSVGW